MLSLPSSSSSSSSSSSRQKYDVFLSFRGEDTRKNFTDHLYAALKRSGIITFRDDSRLEAGEEIAPELLTAIKDSWCSLIVFSQTYAFSGWCLDELAEIVEQRNTRGHKIFPIFYDVDPSDLRKQTGRVHEAFVKHEERYKKNREKTERWRTALTKVANIKGWHLCNRHESEFIEDIVKKISTKLCQSYSFIPDELIGISSRLEELHSKIDVGENYVRIIGICGMGGIGKTTLARVVYTQISSHFDGKSFLANVREVSEKSGLVFLQKQLLSQILLEDGFNLFDVHEGNLMISHRLSHKKVLVVIDDVDNIQHLKWLIGRRDWFGLGSRIIITTRDEQLLRSYGVDDVYKPKTLNAKESLCFFSLKAFNGDTVVPKNDFFELSERVINYAGGLPLALEVICSFLRGIDATQWRDAIERLERDSDKGILDKLRISLDGLKETERGIFLDIACFFNGEDKDFVIKVLDGCEFFANIGIHVLIKKSLLKVDENNKLRMHNLLQEMGRNFVRQKCINEPEKRCRLWEEKDVYHVLMNNTATRTVEGMIIDNKRPQYNTFTLNGDAFLEMKKLRLLRVFYLPNSDHSLEYLSNELRLLEWHGYPFKSLPSGFQLDNLVALLLPYSCIQQLWKGNRPLQKLKFIDLKGCQNLIKTPDFTMAPHLESLNLEGCSKIVDVHPSIVALRKLKLLNLRRCKSLRRFSTKKIGMESLEKLILSGCSNLERFPEIDGEMGCLLELYLDGTGISELPSSIGHLSNLVLLNLKDCSNLVTLPSSIDGCKFLKTLNLSGCSKVETLPQNLQQGPPSRTNLLSFYKILQRRSTDSVALMLPTLSGLSSLRKLNLSDCNIVEGTIPGDICCLSTLQTLNLSGNPFTSLPATLTRLSKLRFLLLSDCKQLKSLPELRTSIDAVCIDGCTSLEVFANPKTICGSSPDWAFFSCINCYRLPEKSNALTILKEFLKVFANARRLFNIIIPGSEIPEWFSHQRDGSSITIPLPCNIRNDTQWMGVVFCCVFVSAFNNDEACGVDKIMGKAFIHGRNFRQISYSGFRFGREYRRSRVKKEHIWLRYWSRDKLYPDSLEDKYSETMNFPCSNFEGHGCYELFESDIECGVSLKVKKCGVRIVFEKDLEELEDLTKEQSSGTGNGVAFTKRKRNISEEEAGPSESDSTAEETPQPKRLQKLLNFIKGAV